MIPPLFDTHLHLRPDTDSHAILRAAREAGVGQFLLSSGNLEDARRYVQLAAVEPGVHVAVGVHPHEASGHGDMSPFRELAADPLTVAIGEVGLDYYYEHSPRAAQRRVFESFLALAAEMRLPVVVHCRDAYEDCAAVLRDFADALAGIDVHSFTGTVAWAEEFLAMGAHLAFNGIITFRKAQNVRDALAVVPPERLLAETDSPYLAPVPHRGKGENQPAYLVEVVERLAIERGLSFVEAAALTSGNGRRLFRLDESGA